MRHPQFRDPVIFERLVSEPTDFGETDTENWVEVFPDFVQSGPMRPVSSLVANQLRENRSEILTMRYRSGIDSTLRIRFLSSGKIVHIKSIDDIDNKHRWLELTCVERDPSPQSRF